MSASLMAAVFRSGPKNPMDRFLLVVLADSADSFGVVRIYVDLLAVQTSMSVQEVEERLRKLTLLGWLAASIDGPDIHVINIMRLRGSATE